jgi:hypothetical protein
MFSNGVIRAAGMIADDMRTRTRSCLAHEDFFVMSRPACEAMEIRKGFQASAQRAHAWVTLLMAGGLTLATLIAVATVSIEVVKAAALH